MNECTHSNPCKQCRDARDSEEYKQVMRDLEVQRPPLVRGGQGRADKQVDRDARTFGLLMALGLGLLALALAAGYLA